MSIYTTLVHYQNIREKKDGLPWYHDILSHIRDQQYPKHAIKNDKKTIGRMAIGFVLDKEILYKKSCDQLLLKEF